MTSEATDLYPQDALEALLQGLSGGDGVGAVDDALALHPADPRLHFLRGSVLAGERRYPEAREAIARAVELAPDYAIARFQLGFLEFTSGEPGVAAQTWAPLQALPTGHALRLFASGLMRLPEDDVDGAVDLLRRGIEANDETPPLNRDMQMLIDELARSQAPDDPEPTSETDLLLRQLGVGGRH
jgi:tetratricopeptide (TPR) repeat protein